MNVKIQTKRIISEYHHRAWLRAQCKTEDRERERERTVRKKRKWYKDRIAKKIDIKKERRGGRGRKRERKLINFSHSSQWIEKFIGALRASERASRRKSGAAQKKVFAIHQHQKLFCSLHVTARVGNCTRSERSRTVKSNGHYLRARSDLRKTH